MADHNLQEPLQPLPPMLNHIITKAVRKYFPRQGRNRDPRALPLQNVAEVFEVRVAAAHAAVQQFEGGDVGSADDFVVGVHVARGAVSLWVFDLVAGKVSIGDGENSGEGSYGKKGEGTSISRKFSGGP